MLSHLFALIRYFFCWLLFFSLERLLFFLYFSEKLTFVPFTGILKSFILGVRMDASAAGYICALPLLTFLVLWNLPVNRFPVKPLRIYTMVFIVISSLIAMVNVNIYREWGSKLNYRALEFAIDSPGEALASSESSPVLTSLFLLAFLIITGHFLFRKLGYSAIHPGRFRWYKLPLSVFIGGLLFLSIRGGWQLAPLNESMAYHSDLPILNHGTVNTEWTFLHSVKSGISADKHPFNYFDKDEAFHITRELYPADTTSSAILNVARPNVVVIILESFTAGVVESLGGEKGINPQMEKLISGGLFFSDIYSAGDRTDKGVIAVLSAFPSQGRRSIIKDNTKHARLPSLYKTFRSSGYTASFYYGGESQFTNMKSYLITNGCQTLVDKYDFDKKDMNSKWGAYDGLVYNKMLDGLNRQKQPFFSTLLSLTNHEPFELPVKPRFPGNEVEQKFRSTAYYADSCLGDFISRARQQPWYKNTLFVIVADHGHRLPGNTFEIYDPGRFRIPMLMFGDAIKPEFRGTKINKTGGQTDIAATVLNQVGIDRSAYKWSKNLLSPNSLDFAFYCWDGGYGFVNKSQAMSFDVVSGRNIYKLESKSDASEEHSIARYAKAYMQVVYQAYLDY